MSIVVSVGMPGQCFDDDVAESFFATIKEELIDTRSWPTREILRSVHRRMLQHEMASQLTWLHGSFEYEAMIHSNASLTSYDELTKVVRQSTPTPSQFRK